MQERPEQIAVVGMAGRFPRSADLDEFWQLLITGSDAIGPVPPDRWDLAEVVEPGRRIPDVGGFIDGVADFDAAFFGISPREAQVLDPQQRLMLETVWRALEDAGQTAAGLRGSRTGVYAGGLWHDYELLRADRGEPATQHSIVGNSLDIVTARVSYFLGLTGPSLTVESSCSSSLVAIHLACQALRSGEVDAALVGGSNLMLTPEVTIGLTHFGGLSATGRCRPFGAGADGFVRGEGVAAIVLKTVGRARADGDRIRAVIAASAVNNDGGGASLVTPHQTAQQELLRRVYGDFGIPLDQVAYIEAHGTGTGRGDPIEAGAIGTVLGRPDRPLPIGSVKSNIGHLEPAAGLAGLIKVVLALEHGVVPPSLHADELNPEIDFAGLGIEVAREPLPLPAEHPGFLGVNSFGWGGTNAHIVVTAAPAGGPAAPRSTGPFVLPVSAHNRAALSERCADLADAVRGGADPRELAAALAWQRDHFDERVAVVADDTTDVAQALAEPIAAGRARSVGRVAFVFPGQGAQWAGMGAELYGGNEAFTRALDECALALQPHLGADVRELVSSDGDWLNRVELVQPALWAMSVSLAAAWTAAGVTPDVVIGHSQGEIAAATVAGLLSVSDGARIVSRRSAILRGAAGHGRMLAVDLDEAAARRALAGFEETVAVAVRNGPRSCVLSGDEDSVLLLREILEAEDVFCRLVEVDYASHSAQMDPFLPEIVESLSGIAGHPGTTRMVSTTTLAEITGPELTPAYWADNLRHPVRFAEAVDQVVADGVTHLIEVSPHPGLAAALTQLAADHPEPPAVLGTLRRGAGSTADLGSAFAAAYVSGLGSVGPRPVARPLSQPPPYPFQRERYWVGDPRARTPRHGRWGLALSPAPAGGGLQGIESVSLERYPWLVDHRVHDTAVLPAGGYLALVQSALAEFSGGTAIGLSGLVLPAALSLADEPVPVAGRWLPLSDAGGTIEISSLTAGSPRWVPHLAARAAFGQPGAPASFPGTLRLHPAESGDDFYQRCRDRGLPYGPAFRTVTAVHRDGDEALVAVEDPGLAGTVERALHPVLWDAILQAGLAVDTSGDTVVPTRIVGLWLSPDARPAWVHARRTGGGIDLSVFGADSTHLGEVRGLTLSALADPVRTEPVGRTLRTLFEPADLDGEEVRIDTVLAGEPAACAELSALTGFTVLGERSASSAQRLVFLAPSGDPLRGVTDFVLLVQRCMRENPAVAITVLTRFGQPAPDDSPVDAAAAAYWGAARVLQAESPQQHVRMIDVDALATPVVAELARPGADQVVLRGERRWILRHAFGGDATEGPPWRVSDAAQPFRLDAARPGRLDSVRRVPLERPALQPGQVRIAVEAASLNFIDVMKALGVYPDGSPDAALLGLDCAGTVTAVGDLVTGLAVGDRVVAGGFGALATELTVPAGQVVPLPERLSMAQGAGLPMALVTAWHGLVELARLQAGDTVLIHSATGGLGLAAIGVARLLGADVLATAGTAAKREYLRELGIGAVFDSRGLDWVEEVSAATGGRGVDVVLNSLPGAAIALGMQSLAEDGRFVEVGKRDIHGGGALALGDFATAASFAAVDLTGLLRRRPERFAATLRACWQHVSSGELSPLPVTEYDFADADRAFATMSRAEHRGKVVLTEPRPSADVSPQPLPGGRLKPTGTYLVTGGLGGLGLAVAEQLAELGAGALALLGRSAPGAAAAARIEALRAGGVQVQVWTADVADEERLAGVLAGIRAQSPVLRGVFHLAGVLDDATWPGITAAGLARVWAGKAAGAAALDRLTRQDGLDLFVLFSSVAGLLGTAGQAGYAAANAYLDGLAAGRRRQGLAGLSVQWGPVAEAGLAAERRDRGDRLADRGMPSLPLAEFRQALVEAIRADEAVVGYLGLDPQRWSQTYPAVAALASWQPLLAASPAAGPAASRLADVPGPQRRELVDSLLRRDAGAVLRIDPAALDAEVPLKSLGLDSLMSLELRNKLESSLGIRLSPTLLWKHGSLVRLGAALTELVDAEAPS